MLGLGDWQLLVRFIGLFVVKHALSSWAPPSIGASPSAGSAMRGCARDPRDHRGLPLAAHGGHRTGV